MSQQGQSSDVPAERVIGLDVGGAHIKLAHNNGFCRHVPFALWQRAGELHQKLGELIAGAPSADRVALTMTGELTDCFVTKHEGVQFIIDATCAASDVPVSVYLIGDEFAEPAFARQHSMRAAASNWFGLATWVARIPEMSGEAGLLVDIGSTTTDMIPFAEGKCLAAGHTDFDRLVSGELVYTGVVRSPLSGIVTSIEYRGRLCPVMNELFATTLDSNIVLGHLVEGACREWTADGQGATITDCATRMARMIGLDRDTFTIDDARHMAGQVWRAQQERIAAAGGQVVARCGVPRHMVISGQGEFLAIDAVRGIAPDARVHSLSRWLDADHSSCAPAVAVAHLLAQGSRAVERGANRK